MHTINRNYIFIVTRKVLHIAFTFITLLSMEPAFAVERATYPIANSKEFASSTNNDSLSYEIVRQVIFPVNKYLIDENSDSSQKLLRDLSPYFKNKYYALTSLKVSGAASPEGPYEWNKTLSRLRTEALIKLISANSSRSLKNLMNIEEVPEDYLYLLTLMQQCHDADYKRVADIVNKYIDTDQAELKHQLMTIDDGRLWRRMLKTYFPEIRAARIFLRFEKKAFLDSLDYPKAKLHYNLPPLAPLQIQIPTEARLSRRELLSVKTNLLLDFAYMPGGYNRFCPIPNVAIEYYPLHGHFTYGASVDFPWWQHYDAHKFFQIRNYQFETRYYLRTGDVGVRGYGKAAFTGLYAQAYIHSGLYGICFDADRGWEGEGVGAGFGIGYVMPITKSGHWRLEFGAQFGAFVTKYDPYQYESPIYPDLRDNLYYYKWYQWGNLFKHRQYRFTWLGPTRVGITLSYDLFYRRRVKKGVSLNSCEAIR